ncbi:hypothetical protein ElyMa_005320100 [Elysia marginata]|uniref:Uncharacterized protein n=1 Tax=Elysia marginata TaxID=1093978 RepID=A0AAV4K026_9GAST|nr:hypothetical protein ElyMa_005320100 [Elysia marginata]
MVKHGCIILKLCFVFFCHGLDLTLERNTPLLPDGTRRSCGVLTCEEKTIDGVTSASDENQNEANVSFSRLEAMEVLKRNPGGGSRVSVGSVSTQHPRLSRVANGLKITGLLEAGRVSIRVELFKQEDCKSGFTCVVRGLDSQAKNLVSVTKLAQQADTQTANLGQFAASGINADSVPRPTVGDEGGAGGRVPRAQRPAAGR